MKKVLYILFMATSFCAMAQNQTIDPTVEVNRDFQGKIMEIAKGKLNTTIADSLNIYNIDFNYSFFNRQYKDLYEFSPIPSVNLVESNGADECTFMAKGGIGYPLSPEVALWYTPLKGENGNYLSFDGQYNHFNGKGTKENTYRAGGNYTRIFKWGEAGLSAGFNGGGNTVKSETAPFSHRFTQIAFDGNIKPIVAREAGRKFNWGLGGEYIRTMDKSNASSAENYGLIEGYFGPTFGKYSQLTADISIKGVEYEGGSDYHYGVFEIVPQYKYERGGLTLHLGARLSGAFSSKDDADRYHNFLLPAVNLTFVLQREKLWAYGILDGENHLNSWAALLEGNRYINPDETPQNIMMGSTPLKIEGGLKGRTTDKFSYRIYARYAVHRGMLQYAYNDGGWYNAFNSNHNEFGAGADITAKLENFLLQGEFDYASFSKGKNSTFTDGLQACGKPELSGKISAMYNWKGGISAGLACKGWGSYYAAIWESGECRKINGNADLDINVQYAFSPLLSVYLRGENILNSPSYNHPFHTGRGGCAIAGIIVKL